MNVKSEVCPGGSAKLFSSQPHSAGNDKSEGAQCNDLAHILDMPGFLRLETVLMIVPVGRSKWYEGRKLGVYPAPVPLGVGRRRAYRRSDIKALVKRLEAGNG